MAGYDFMNDALPRSCKRELSDKCHVSLMEGGGDFPVTAVAVQLLGKKTLHGWCGHLLQPSSTSRCRQTLVGLVPAAWQRATLQRDRAAKHRMPLGWGCGRRPGHHLLCLFAVRKLSIALSQNVMHVLFFH